MVTYEPLSHLAFEEIHVPSRPITTSGVRRRIALFIPSLHGGGAERVLLDLASEFVAAGHDVDLVLMNCYPSPLLELVPPRVALVDLHCPRFWASTPSMVRYIRRRRPDGIIAAMPLANAIAGYARTLARVPLRLVLSEHNYLSLAFGDLERFPKDAMLAPLIRIGYRFADAIIAVSQGVAERLRQAGLVRPELVRVVYNPAYSPRIEILARQPAPHAWLEDPSIPVVVGSGRLEEQKDFPTLLEAFALLKAKRPARLIILGEGSQRPALEERARRLNVADDVALPGFVINPWAYMSRAAVFALSSIHEGLGNVLVEALALGTPVVSTDCPSGPAEILAHGRFGTLVQRRDARALAAAIGQAIDTPAQKSALQSRAREFSIDVACSGYLDAFGFGRLPRGTHS